MFARFKVDKVEICSRFKVDKISRFPMGQEFNLEHENANLEILKSCSTQEFSTLKS